MNRIRVRICGVKRARDLRAAVLADAYPLRYVLAPKSARPPIPAIGLSAGNIRAVMESVRPWAVDVSSGLEDAPGIKNRDKLVNSIKEVHRE